MFVLDRCLERRERREFELGTCPSKRVNEKERERESVCVCVCEREREREREVKQSVQAKASKPIGKKLLQLSKTLIRGFASISTI